MNKNKGNAIIFPFQATFISNINESKTNIVGLQFALFDNCNNGPTTIIGAQVAMGNHNANKSTVVGVRLAPMWNGIPWEHHEMLNPYYPEPGGDRFVPDGTTIYGLDVSFFGNSAVAIYGLQIGAVNISDSVTGLQIGIVNYTKSLRGIQIGLVNINRAGPLPFFPIINVGF